MGNPVYSETKEEIKAATPKPKKNLWQRLIQKLFGKKESK